MPPADRSRKNHEHFSEIRAGEKSSQRWRSRGELGKTIGIGLPQKNTESTKGENHRYPQMDTDDRREGGGDSGRKPVAASSIRNSSRQRLPTNSTNSRECRSVEAAKSVWRIAVTHAGASVTRLPGTSEPGQSQTKNGQGHGVPEFGNGGKEHRRGHACQRERTWPVSKQLGELAPKRPPPGRE